MRERVGQIKLATLTVCGGTRTDGTENDIGLSYDVGAGRAGRVLQLLLESNHVQVMMGTA